MPSQQERGGGIDPLYYKLSKYTQQVLTSDWTMHQARGVVVAVTDIAIILITPFKMFNNIDSHDHLRLIVQDFRTTLRKLISNDFRHKQC